MRLPSTGAVRRPPLKPSGGQAMALSFQMRNPESRAHTHPPRAPVRGTGDGSNPMEMRASGCRGRGGCVRRSGHVRGEAGSAAPERRPSAEDVPGADVSGAGASPRRDGCGGRSTSGMSGRRQGPTGQRLHGSRAKRQRARRPTRRLPSRRASRRGGRSPVGRHRHRWPADIRFPLPMGRPSGGPQGRREHGAVAGRLLRRGAHARIKQPGGR